MREPRGLAVVLPILAALLAVPAQAVDGVIEINQAKAMAGGVTPGDSAGFPVSLTVGGSYRLTSNLVVAAGGQGTPENLDGIFASSPSQPREIDIDLNGFAIVGPVTCTLGKSLSCSSNQSGSGQGLDATGASPVRIHDGTIVGFAGNGIEAFGELVRVSNVKVQWCLNGAVILLGQIENVMVVQNRVDGIVADGVTLSEISASRNGEDGIDLQRSVLDGCVAMFNESDGVSADSNSIVRNCALQNNGDYGLNCAACGYSGNSITSGSTGTVNGGLQIGQNVCDGDLTCP